MRALERTTQFKRDYKREMKGRHGATLRTALAAVLRPLIANARLPERYRDHGVCGTQSGFRDCLVKLDLVLIYDKFDTDTLRLVRLGSLSELGL